MDFFEPKYTFGRSKAELQEQLAIGNYAIRSGRIGPAPKQIGTPLEAGELAAFRQLVVASHLGLAESGFPYYRVWPDYVDMFRKTKLDTVRLSNLAMPFSAWIVKLPKTYELQVLGRRLCAVKVFLLNVSKEPVGLPADPSQAECLLLMLTTTSLQGDDMQESVVFTNLEAFRSDPHATVEDTVTVPSSRVVQPLGDETEPPADGQWQEALREVYRLVFSVGFVATGSYKFVHPDVLSSDVTKLLEATRQGATDRVASLADKARRRRHGERGFTVGRFHAIDVLRPPSATTEGEAESKRELSHSHLRSGHFHVYWTGAGRTDRTVRFVAPVVVRPDLPPQEAAALSRDIR